MPHSTLFATHSVEDYFRQLRQEMCNVIDNITSEEIEHAEPVELAEKIAQRFCVNCPVLLEKEMGFGV